MKHSHARFSFAFILCPLFVFVADKTRADLNGLFRRLPPQANILVVLKVDEILQTPLASREKWREDLESAAETHSLLLPKEAAEFALAAEMDMERDIVLWRTAVMNVRNATSLKSVAAARGQSLEHLVSTPAFRSPLDAYVVEFGPKTFGVMVPANRRKATGWCRLAQANRQTALSNYLERAVKYADSESAHVVMALDLTDSVPQHIIRSRLDEFETARRHSFDRDEVAAVLSSIRGATLRLNITDKVIGQLRVDFDRTATSLQGFAKPLMLEVLGRNGSAIDDFEQWDLRVADKALALQGTLSPDSMSFLLSVVDLPSADLNLAGDQKDFAATAASAGQDSEDVPESLVALASKEHFRKVTTSLRRLRLKRDVRTLGQKARWIENTARNIDRMPVLNVDEELLEYSGEVANKLRDISMSIRGIGIRSAERGAKYYGSFNVGQGTYYGDYGYYGNRTSVGGTYRRNVRAEESARGAESAREIGQQIAEDTAQIRRLMSQRYQIEF